MSLASRSAAAESGKDEMNTRLLILSALALLPGLVEAEPEKAPRRRVLVELFTSQG